ADKTQKAKKSFEEYQAKLDETLRARREPYLGFQEKDYVQALEQKFAALEKVLNAADQPYQIEPGEDPAAPVLKAISELVATVDDLNATIHANLHDRIKRSRDESTVSLWIVGGTCVTAVFLMIGLL